MLVSYGDCVTDKTVYVLVFQIRLANETATVFFILPINVPTDTFWPYRKIDLRPTVKKNTAMIHTDIIIKKCILTFSNSCLV